MQRFINKFSIASILSALALMLAPIAGFAQEVAQEATPLADTGDTAWMIVATAFVLLMIIPGLALFYGGLVRRENIVAALMQTFATCALVSVLWVVVGYSLAFTSGSGFIGGFDRVLMKGIELGSLSGTIPESVFVVFQLTFAAITVALIFGSVADRIKFSSLLCFAALWLLFVYVPVAHWVWGPEGFLGGTGMTDYKGFLGFGPFIDFAGGAVVHVNSGIAGLVAAIVLGKRAKGVANGPGNLAMCVIGASLLWVGWFGFNAGSAVAANGRAGMAMLVTHTAAAAAALAWMFAEWIKEGKPSVAGTVTGAVAGLVAITPASGFVGASGALIIGLAAGVLCYVACTSIKEKFGYDDSLDVFGVHCFGGIIGSLLTGVFAESAIGGVAGVLEGNTSQFMAQVVGTVVVLVYSGVVSYILLKITQLFFGLRVSAEVERKGLSVELHGQTM
jgi:Amt family ammonium transporter